MASISFHALAERELNAAAQYYESRSPGLGARFLDAAERCGKAVLSHPDAGSPIAGEIRRRQMQTFPYALIYRVAPDGVRILAVADLRRKPMYWVGRS